MTPKMIGHYEFKYALGSGGAGQVSAYLDQNLGRMVAIKAMRSDLSSDPTNVQRFLAEAKNLAVLSHPNIATVYTLHREGQDWFMVMELVPGFTLDEVLVPLHNLRARECLAIAAQAASGFAYAHRMGVIHRDIKPSNLMLTDSGLLKIVDFGIARARGSKRMTQQGSIVATLHYGSPEQIKGEDCDERSDIYSLACVIYEILAGTPPFIAATTDYTLINAQVHSPPPPLADLALDRGLEQALMKALSKKPDDRFASMEDFSRALGATAVLGEAATILRDNVLPGLRRRPPAETRFVDHPSGGGQASASPSAAKAGASRSSDAAATPSWTAGARRPALVLGGVATVVGIGAIFGLYDFLHSSPTQTYEVGRDRPEPSIAANRPTNPVPPSSTILPSPDAGSVVPQAPRPAPPPQNQATIQPATIKGVVGYYTIDGWPVIDGRVVKLAGIEAVPQELMKRFVTFLTRQGQYLECEPTGGALYRCLSDQKEDVAQGLLAGGSTRATPDAGPTYLAAEQQARQDKRGVWKSHN